MMSDSHIPDLGPGFPPFALLRDEVGYVPAVYRAQSAAPGLIEAQTGMLTALLFKEGVLNRLQKEQILLTVAAVERNRYSVAAQYQTLKLMGMNEGRIGQMLADPSHPQLPPLLAFVSRMAKPRGGIDSHDVESLTGQGLAEAAVLEGIVTAAFGGFTNTMAAGLGVPPDFKHEPDLPGEDDSFDEPRNFDCAGPCLPTSAQSLPDDVVQLIRDTFAFIPNIFLPQSMRPDIVRAEVNLVRAVLLSGDPQARIRKEQILLAVAAADRNAYGVALQIERLARLGMARELCLQSLPEPLQTAGLSQEQIIAIVAATALARFLNLLQRGLGAVPDFALPADFEAFLKKQYLLAAESRHSPRAAVTEDPDAPLVESAKTGNLDAFEQLVTKHSQRVYRTLIGILGNADEARDAMQDTFLKAFEHLGSFQQRAKFGTWLVSIASNRAIERLRERRPMESLDYENFESEQWFRPRQVQSWTANPEQLYSKAEMRRLVEDRIMALPAKYRVVLLLRDLEELSTAEAAAALGLGVTALKARLLRGRLMLREALAPYFEVTQKGAAS